MFKRRNSAQINRRTNSENVISCALQTIPTLSQSVRRKVIVHHLQFSLDLYFGLLAAGFFSLI